MSEAAAPRPNHLAPVPDNQDQRQALLEELTAKALHHRRQAEAHTAAAKAADAAIMKLHGHQGGTIQVGANQVTWKNPSKSFAKDEFVKAYPREANPYFYTEPEPVLDVSAIPPKLKDTFMRPGEGDGSIVIK